MLERISVHREIKIPLWEQYSNGSCSITRTTEIVMPDTLTPDEYKNLVKTITNNLNTFADDEIQKRITETEIMIKNRGAEGLGHRFYYKDDKCFPSVTSIITPDAPPIPYLAEHGELGIWFDGYVKNYFLTKIKTIPSFTDKGNISQTSTKLLSEFDKWLEKYNEVIKIDKIDVQCLCDEYLYAGTCDLIGSINIRGEWKPAVFDVKKTKKIQGDILEKYAMQLSAYRHTMPEIDVGVIISPYLAPLVITDCFGKFLIKRGEYKQRFGK